MPSDKLESINNVVNKLTSSESLTEAGPCGRSTNVYRTIFFKNVWLVTPWINILSYADAMFSDFKVDFLARMHVFVIKWACRLSRRWHGYVGFYTLFSFKICLYQVRHMYAVRAYFYIFLLKEKCKAYCMNSFASNVNHTNPTCFAKSLLCILADSQR
jgi:hypothetical protein